MPYLWIVPWALWPGCSDPASSDPDAETCEQDRPARSPLQRLTREELDNTLFDLLGDETRPASRLLPPERLGGFSNNVDVRTVDEATASGYASLARDVAVRANQDAETWMGCAPAEDGCVAGWLPAFLTRAWRRPDVAPEAAARLLDRYAVYETEWGADTALSMLLEIVLQSPDFLYRVEPTVLDAAPGTAPALQGYEVATRLSYFLWSTMPDDTLWQAALAGELDTAEGVGVHTRRMLDDPRADANVHRFFDEWMELGGLDNIEKDPERYPDFDAALAERMREEVHATIDEVWFVEGARFDTLLTAPFTMVDAALAEFYGWPDPGADGFVRVDRDPAHHAGVLTQGAFLSIRAHPYETSPIHRGMFVRGPLLCEELLVPDDLEVEAPEPLPDATVRETLAAHQAEPVCASCHALIDPPGLAFEHFDAVGRYRAHDGIETVDASGDLLGTDVDGPFDGVPELAARLAQSHDVHRCFGAQWFRFAHARRHTDPDACSIDAAVDVFRQSGLDMRELIVATTTANAFRFAAPAGGVQ